jgi:hypothetical protein
MNESKAVGLSEDEYLFCERVELGMLTVNTDKRLLAILRKLQTQIAGLNFAAARDCNVGLAEAENITEYCEGYEVKNK